MVDDLDAEMRRIDELLEQLRIDLGPATRLNEKVLRALQFKHEDFVAALAPQIGGYAITGGAR